MLKQQKGVKADELKWTGVEEWLKGQKSVTKEQILDYMKNNRVQIMEVVKGKNERNLAFLETEKEKIIKSVRDKHSQYQELGLKYDDSSDVIALNRINSEIEKEKNGGNVRYSNYQLEGEKENYKEVLVTMPISKSKQEYVVEQDYRIPNTFYAVNQKTGVKLKFGSYELAKSQAERLSRRAARF